MEGVPLVVRPLVGVYPGPEVVLVVEHLRVSLKFCAPASRFRSTVTLERVYIQSETPTDTQTLRVFILYGFWGFRYFRR